MAYVHRLVVAREATEEAANRQTDSLAGLAVALLLVVVCLYVGRQLATSAAVEDCLLAGRSTCGMIVTHPS